VTAGNEFGGYKEKDHDMMHTVAEKDHAELGPSSWDRWSNCPGSIVLSRGLPRTTSSYAAEGTVAHEIADRVLREEVAEAKELLDQTFQCEGYDIVVDDEMVGAVNFYVDYVRQLAPNDDDIILPEQQVPIGHLTGESGATGTSDSIVIANGGKLMHVVDLKYGKGVRVNAEGNGQAKMYALGALHKFGAVYEDVEEVEIHIVMPRLEDGVTSEVLSIGELEEFRDQVELAAAAVALNDKARDLQDKSNWELELVPGEKQCKFCPAKGICPALQAEVSKELAPLSHCTAEDFADLSLPKQAASLELKPDATNDQLAQFMRAVPLIEEAIKGVRAEVERRLFDGQEIPGFYLGVGRKGNRQWVNEDADGKPVDIEAELKKRLGSKAYEKKLIGVPAAEKLFKSKPQTWKKIKDLITQPDGKPSVCAEGDKNPRYVPVSAEDFADLSAQTEVERLLS
jgi:hypothetical protein